MAREQKNGKPLKREEPRDEKEELAYIRQRASSLTMRGHYKECFKLIEDNIKFLYFKERWPENFLTCLRFHKKCYPAMGQSAAYEDYLTALLRKNGIPYVFVSMLRGSDSSIVWNSEFFRDLVLVAEGKGDYEEALAYCEVLIKLDKHNSNSYLLKGYIFDDLDRGDEAIEAYQHALELNKTNYQASHYLAKRYVKTNPKQALSYIEDAIEAAPGEAAFYAVRGEVQVALGQKAEAYESYTRAASLDPINPDYPYRLGELLLADNQRLKALRQYSQAVGLNEKHIPSLTRLAKLTGEDQPELALPYVNTICTEEPKNLWAALLRAQLLRKTGQTRLAIKQYYCVVELDDKNEAAYIGLGDLYYPENPQRAIQNYDVAIALNPKNPMSHLGRAKSLEAIKEIPGAITEYKTTTSLDETIAEAWGSLGMLHLESNPHAAADYLQRAVSYDPENPYYHAARGAALMQLKGREQQALEAFADAVRYDPGNASIHLRLARLLERVGNNTSALEHYKQAASLDNNSAEAFFGLARHLRQSNPDLAITHINSAISLDATNGEYYYLKARILDELGNRKDSLLNLKQSLDNDSGNTESMQELSEVLGGESPRVALMYINRAIELAPDNSRYICTRATLLYNVGQAKQALGQYEAALKLDENNHEAHYGLGRILADKDDPKALECFDRAIALAPDVPQYHAAKAAFLGKDLEDPVSYKKALASYDDAIKLDNQLWPVILERAKLYDAHGDLVEAQQDYRRVLLINRDCLDATARMGEILSEHGSAAGIGYLDHAIELDPGSSLPYAWKARLLYTLGQGELAEEACRGALTAGLGGAEIYYILAGVLRGKLPETALKYANEAIRLDASDYRFPLLRGDVHAWLEENTPARESYDLALSLNPGCHEALAKIAELLLLEQNPEALGYIDRAIAISPQDARYQYIRAEILDMVKEQTAQAIEAVTLAVKADPDNVVYRELLVALLQKNRSFLRAILEKRKLEKCRRKQEQIMASMCATAALPEAPPEPSGIAPEPEIQDTGPVSGGN